MNYPKPSDETLRQTLSPMQYQVTQQNATEPPYVNKYYHEFRPGIYVDIATGQPLFLSTDKYHSGCGWPAFTQPISEEVMRYLSDDTHGMHRTEVRSSMGDSHLGHVFPDGPAERGGTRYCINSAALRFIPLDEMESEGYADLIPLVEETEKEARYTEILQKMLSSCTLDKERYHHIENWILKMAARPSETKDIKRLQGLIDLFDKVADHFSLPTIEQQQSSFGSNSCAQ